MIVLIGLIKFGVGFFVHFVRLGSGTIFDDGCFLMGGLAGVSRILQLPFQPVGMTGSKGTRDSFEFDTASRKRCTGSGE